MKSGRGFAFTLVVGPSLLGFLGLLGGVGVVPPATLADEEVSGEFALALEEDAGTYFLGEMRKAARQVVSRNRISLSSAEGREFAIQAFLQELSKLTDPSYQTEQGGEAQKRAVSAIGNKIQNWIPVGENKTVESREQVYLRVITEAEGLLRSLAQVGPITPRQIFDFYVVNELKAKADDANDVAPHQEKAEDLVFKLIQRLALKMLRRARMESMPRPAMLEG